MSLKTFVCPRCVALRSIESWRDAGPDVLAIGLAPCGHVIERIARLEWRITSDVPPLLRCHGRRARAPGRSRAAARG